MRKEVQMSDDKAASGRSGRRNFLVGLLTGAGVVAAVAGANRPIAARPAGAEPSESPSADPVLYRRTEEAERYYRTLYR
jgi:hypothetical protein